MKFSTAIVAIVSFLFLIGTVSSKKQSKNVHNLRQQLSSSKQELAAARKELSNLKATCVKVCPSDFVYNSTTNLCYKLQLKNNNWTSASVGCKSLHANAHLVIVDNAAEQIGLTNFLKSNTEAIANAGCYFDVPPVDGGYSFYTAGQRVDPEHETPFVWRILDSNGTATESQREMTYSNFRPGEPNFGLGGAIESCAHLFGNWGYMWNDCPCPSPMCSVCEVDV